MRNIKSFSTFQPINEELAKKDVLAFLLSLSFLKPVQAEKIANDIEKKSEGEKKVIIKSLSLAKDSKEVNSIVYAERDSLSVKREHIHPPTGYKSLSISQRRAWNEYLIYLDTLGLAGNSVLDEQSRGLDELKKYLEARPDNPLNEWNDKKQLVKCIQYEMIVLRKGESGFPGLSDDDLLIFQKWLEISRPAYMLLIPSEIDGKPGQLTTRLWYPAKTSSGVYTGNSFDYASQIEEVALTMITKYGIKVVGDVDLTKKISHKNKVFLSKMK
jgi:hypothetical protein